LTSNIIIVQLICKNSSQSKNHTNLSNQLSGKHKYNLEYIAKTEKGVTGYVFAQILYSSSVAKSQEEEKIAENIPIHIVEIPWVPVVVFDYDS
jgi:hypothetical protein